MMFDTITLQDIDAVCILGCNPIERVTPRPVTINVTLSVDISAAAKSDDLTQTVDYGKLVQHIVSATEASSFQLIEALADFLADLCLKTSPRVHAATLTVTKPAPCPHLKAAAVTVTRTRTKS